MESNSIPAQQVSIHEVNAEKKNHTSSERGKQVTLQIYPLRSLKSQAGEHKLNDKGHIKMCRKVCGKIWLPIFWTQMFYGAMVAFIDSDKEVWNIHKVQSNYTLRIFSMPPTS